MAKRHDLTGHTDLDMTDGLAPSAAPEGGDPATFFGQVAETVVNAVEFLMDLFCIFG